MLTDAQRKELRQLISEKLEEASMDHYEGNTETLIIISVNKGNIKILPAYSNFERAVLNIGLDMAKRNILEETRKDATEVKRDN